MTLSCDKDSGIETVQPACKLSENRIKELLNITQDRKIEIQEMKKSFVKINQVTLLEVFSIKRFIDSFIDSVKDSLRDSLIHSEIHTEIH